MFPIYEEYKISTIFILILRGGMYEEVSTIQ